MYRIGVDVGSSYTKYCVVQSNAIVLLQKEKTPLKQTDYFRSRFQDLFFEYENAEIISCGYGKDNVGSVRSINELTALAKGSYYLTGKDGIVLDIGGQDTKVITQKAGRLTGFFINDKCAAGSGIFLTSVLDRVGYSLNDVHLDHVNEPPIRLSSICALFAQSEIVELIANNKSEEEIIQSVIWHIFAKAKTLLDKVETEPILLSGGLTSIPGIAELASNALERECWTVKEAAYMSAIGCSVY